MLHCALNIAVRQVVVTFFRKYDISSYDLFFFFKCSSMMECFGDLASISNALTNCFVTFDKGVLQDNVALSVEVNFTILPVTLTGDT